jgi:hypothetical protein
MYITIAHLWFRLVGHFNTFHIYQSICHALLISGNPISQTQTSGYLRPQLSSHFIRPISLCVYRCELTDLGTVMGMSVRNEGGDTLFYFTICLRSFCCSRSVVGLVVDTEDRRLSDDSNKKTCLSVLHSFPLFWCFLCC